MSETESSDKSAENTEQKTPVQEINPDVEPEVVGFHSGLDTEQCTNYLGEHVENIERCENEATHTCVVYDGLLHELSMCDECGEPEEVPDDREWSA